MNRASTLVLAGLAPSTAFVVAGGGSGYAVMLATGDVQFAASLGVVGGWLAFLATGLLLGEMARWLGSGNSDTAPMAEPEEVRAVKPSYVAPGYMPLNTQYHQAAAGLVKIEPPLPEFVGWQQVRRLAWGLTRQGLPLTYSEWSPSVFHRNSQFIPLMEWMRGERLTKNRSGNPKNGVMLTARGEDWMESIITAFGPPPIKQR